MSKEYRAGDTLDLEIIKIVPRGNGLGFVEGLTVFTSLAAPGDRVRVTLTEVKGKTAFAEIEKVIEASTVRIDPPCPYFGACGGCDFQQMSYAAQLDAKLAMIRDCIERIAKLKLDVDIKMIASPVEFGYRLRAQWHVEPADKAIGYYRRNSRDLVDIDHCMVLVPELDAELTRLRSELEWQTFAGPRAQIDAAVGDASPASLFSAEMIEPTAEIAINALGERFGFSARSFFQGNRFLLEELLSTALGDARGGTAIDLYSGVGFFSLPLARRFERVTAIEENPDAVEFARRNAENARLENIEFTETSVRDYLASGEAPKPDFVLLDPPRVGTEKETMQNLIALVPPHISYVACEPSILARDLRRLVDEGYRVDSVTAIDLFPQTHHVETIAHLSLQ